MKKRTLNGKVIPSQKPVELQIVILDPADETLPAPRGKMHNRQPKTKAQQAAEALQRAAEGHAYQRTLGAGGLIDSQAEVGRATRPSFYDVKTPWGGTARNSSRNSTSQNNTLNYPSR